VNSGNTSSRKKEIDLKILSMKTNQMPKSNDKTMFELDIS